MVERFHRQNFDILGDAERLKISAAAEGAWESYLANQSVPSARREQRGPFLRKLEERLATALIAKARSAIAKTESSSDVEQPDTAEAVNVATESSPASNFERLDAAQQAEALADAQRAWDEYRTNPAIPDYKRTITEEEFIAKRAERWATTIITKAERHAAAIISEADTQDQHGAQIGAAAALTDQEWEIYHARVLRDIREAHEHGTAPPEPPRGLYKETEEKKKRALEKHEFYEEYMPVLTGTIETPETEISAEDRLRLGDLTEIARELLYTRHDGSYGPPTPPATLPHPRDQQQRPRKQPKGIHH